MPDEIKQWLTKKQWEDYVGFMGYACVHKALDTSGVDRLVKDLAATRELSERRRVLMEKHQYICGWTDDNNRYCVECGQIESEPCYPDCAWDAALKGVEGGVRYGKNLQEMWQ